MESSDDPFQAEDIDENIEQLAQAQEESENDINARLIQSLQHHYGQEIRQATLQRAWQEISRYHDTVSFQNQQRHALSERTGSRQMQGNIPTTPSRRKLLPAWSTLAAAIIVLVLITSMIAITNIATQKNSGPTSSGGPAQSPCATTAQGTPTLCITVTPPPGYSFATPPAKCPPTPTPPPIMSTPTPISGHPTPTPPPPPPVSTPMPKCTTGTPPPISTSTPTPPQVIIAPNGDRYTLVKPGK